VDQLRDSIARGELVHDVRRLLQSGAEDHGRWLRENIRYALVSRRQDSVAVSALTGLAPGTVRGFMNGRPSSINNVLLIAEAIGYTLAELDRPPAEFLQRLHATADGADGADGGAIGASLLAFEQSPTAMAIVLLDGTVIKVNRELRELLGYEEAELIGASAATLSIRTETDRAERRDELEATDAIHARVTQLRRKDGSVVSALTSALVVRDEDGQPRYVIARAAPVPAPSG
jgi:PAS domain S-box-containing protein